MYFILENEVVNMLKAPLEGQKMMCENQEGLIDSSINLEVMCVCWNSFFYLIAYL